MSKHAACADDKTCTSYQKLHWRSGCVCMCVCTEGAWLYTCQIGCSDSPVNPDAVVNLRERERESGCKSADTHACMLGLVHTELKLHSFYFWEIQADEDKCGQIGCTDSDMSAATSHVSNMISLTPRPSTNPRCLAILPKTRHAHTRTHTWRLVKSVSLCSLPYTCRAPGRNWRLVGGCCVCLWGGGKQTKHHRNTQEKRNERQR